MDKVVNFTSRIEIIGNSETPIACIVPFTQQRLNDLKAMPASTKKTGINCSATALYLAGLLDADLCLYYSDLLDKGLKKVEDEMKDDDDEIEYYLRSYGFDKVASKTILTYAKDVVEGAAELKYGSVNEDELFNGIDQMKDNNAIVIDFGSEKHHHVIVIWKHDGIYSVLDAQRGKDYAGNYMNSIYNTWTGEEKVGMDIEETPRPDWAKDILTQTDTYLRIDCENHEIFKRYCREQGKAWDFYGDDEEIQYEIVAANPIDVSKGIIIHQLALDNVRIQNHSSWFTKELEKKEASMEDVTNEGLLVEELGKAPHIIIKKGGRRRTYRSKRRRMTRRR